MADHSITIDVKANGAESTVKVLKEIRDDVNSLKKSDVTINFRVNTSGVTRAINSLKSDLMGVAGANAELQAAIGELISVGFQGVIDKIDEISGMRVSPEVDSSGLEDAAAKAERLADGLSVAAGVASSLSSIFSVLGDFGGMFASSFEGMSNMFNFDALGTAKRYLTAMATRAITGQVGGIIERYDIMNTFEDYMELAGVPNSVAEESLSRVDQSIRGIPIGLDEAAFRLRKYQMYMNDIERATNFTIGIQKAITAGGASEQMKTTAYTQIDRLLATGKLGQSRQWLSLFNGLGVSLRFLREELALDPTADLKQIAGDLANGTIPVEDFIHAIERLADNEGLDRALEIYKGTIEAWQANINNAIKRAGQNVLENINSVMEDTLGFGITGGMKRIRDGIDTMSKEAGKYIQENPQNVQMLGDSIGGLIERVMSLDGGRFVTNIVNNLSGIANVVGRIFDSLPPGFIEDFVSFATTWAGPLATVAGAAQSGLGVLLGVFERIQSIDPAEIIEKIVKQIESMADVVSKLLGLIPDGLLGDLMAFGLVWGKPLASILGSIGSALRDMSAVTTAGGGAKGFGSANTLFGQLYWLVTSHPAIAAAAAAIGGLAAVLKAHSEEMDLQVEYNLSSNGIETAEFIEADIQQFHDAIENQREEFNATMQELEDRSTKAHGLVEDIKSLNEEIAEAVIGPYSGDYEGAKERNDLLKNSLIAQQIAQIEELKSLYPELRLEIDQTTGLLTEQSMGVLNNADAYIEYATAEGRMAALQEQVQKETSNIISLMGDNRTRQQEIENYKRQISTWERQIDQAERSIMLMGAENPQNPQIDIDADLIETWKRSIAETKDSIAAEEAAIAINEKQIKKADDAIREYGRDIAQLQSSQRQFAGTEWKLDGINVEYDQLDDRLQNIIADYALLKEEAEKAAQAMIGGFDKIEDQAAHNLSETNTILEGNNAEGKEYQDKLTELWSWVDEQLATEEGQKFIEENGAAIQALIAQAEQDFGSRGLLYGLVDAITGGNTEDVQKYFQEQLDQSGIIDTVSGLTADLEAMFKYGPEWKEFRDGNQDAEELSWMKNLTDGIVQEVVNLAETLGPGGEVGQPLAEAVTQSFTPVVDALGEVKTAAENADGAISNLATTASNKAGDFSSLVDSLHSVRTAAFTATAMVAALASAIDSLHDKTVNIVVNMANGGAVRAAWSNFGASLGFGAWGGPADYLSIGGFPGTGRGIDTIPAWLAPGEYVMRRAAVGLFGSNFMKRVNRMDIGGAFDALMMRISNPMNYRGNTYNRDNHATVNNYFMGDNGQSYSQRKAYRFAGSL